MPAASSAKTSTEIWQGIWEQYQRETPGAFRIADVVNYAVDVEGVPLPKVDPKAILRRRLKRALREVRVIDAQGVKVRGMLPAKLPSVDENGNMIFDVEWDNIHHMSADHALLCFEQWDENIGKQQNAATKNLKSFLRNNPNAKGHEHQFKFNFFKEEAEPQIVEQLDETPKKSKSLVEYEPPKKGPRKKKS